MKTKTILFSAVMGMVISGLTQADDVKSPVSVHDFEIGQVSTQNGQAASAKNSAHDFEIKGNIMAILRLLIEGV